MDMKLLIVDDNTGMRAMIRQLMQPLFDFVEECEDGVSSIKVFDRNPSDVVIMDIEMPRMDGIEATRAILRRHPNAHICLVTAYDRAEYKHRACSCGAASFHMKDDLIELYGELETYITSSREMA